MKYFVLFFTLLLAGTVFAQTANVIEIEPTDVIVAKTAWQNLQEAQKEWDDLQVKFKEKYTTKKVSCNAKGILTIYGCDSGFYLDTKDGFQNGFEFSSDFRFIVPKPKEPSGNLDCGVIIRNY